MEHTSLQNKCPHRVVVSAFGASKQRGQVRLSPSFVVKFTLRSSDSESADTSAFIEASPLEFGSLEVAAKGVSGGRMVEDDASAPKGEEGAAPLGLASRRRCALVRPASLFAFVKVLGWILRSVTSAIRAGMAERIVWFL
jgi:hypothetical protein